MLHYSPYCPTAAKNPQIGLHIPSNRGTDSSPLSTESLQGDTGWTLSPAPAPGAPRSGSWTVDPTLLLSPIFQLHPKSPLGQLSVQQAQPLQCKCLRVSEAGSEIHQDLEVGWRPASGLAGECSHACSTHRQFMGHGQWCRPSAPLHFIKKEEGRNTNKQRLHGDHTHGTGRQGQAIPS